jgi:uncharacterized protein (DUF2235 family)
MTTHIFCFDGTWADKDSQTNIFKMWEMMAAEDQVTYYFAGPGNDDENSWLMQRLGGAFGIGSWEIRDRALEVLEAAHHPGDRIMAAGFSRGAAIARMFCAKVTHDIDLLCCFDTVFARLPFGDAQQETLFSDLHVSPSVMYAIHAVALDEDRESFAPNLMNKRPGITEMWFPGGHSDIGGGNRHTGLSDGVLQWAFNEALVHGIHNNGVTLHPDALATMTVSDAMLRHDKRRIGVMQADGWINDVVQYSPSFLERLEGDPVYRAKWRGEP